MSNLSRELSNVTVGSVLIRNNDRWGEGTLVNTFETLTVVQTNQVVQVVRGTAAHPQIVFLRHRVLLEYNAPSDLLVVFDRSTKVPKHTSEKYRNVSS